MRTNRPKLTAANVAEMVRLREECRRSVTFIARKFGVSTSAVNYRLLRNGVDPWDPKKNNGSKPRGAFSAEEDARMLELGRQGVAPHRIAALMNRPRTSLMIRLLTLEVRAENALGTAA